MTAEVLLPLEGLRRFSHEALDFIEHECSFSAESGTTELSFEPGSVGLIFRDGGKITHVEDYSQASINGVKPGWVILRVAGKFVSALSTHAEIGHLFSTANGQRTTYTVLFSTIDFSHVQTSEDASSIESHTKDVLQLSTKEISIQPLPFDCSSIAGTTLSLDALCRSLRDRERIIDDTVHGLEGLCNDLWKKCEPKVPDNKVEVVGYCMGLCSRCVETHVARNLPCKECTDIVSFRFAELERMIQREEDLQQMFRLDRASNFPKEQHLVEAQCAAESSAIGKLHEEIAKLKVSMAKSPAEWYYCDSNIRHASLTANTIAQVAEEFLEGVVKINVVVPSGIDIGIAVGDEILIGDEFYRLKSVESRRTWLLASGLVKPISIGDPIQKLDIAPSTTPHTQAFINCVESLDGKHIIMEATDKVCNRDDFPGLKEPIEFLDAKERKKALLQLYLSESLYSKVNKAIYEDSEELLMRYGGCIRECMELFRVGQDDAVLETFVRGTAWRHCKIPDEVLYSYDKGQLFSWSSFTSMSDIPGLAFGGDVIVQIDSSKCRAPCKGTYYPCHLRDLSLLPNKSEVLWPPNCQFRFVNLLALGSTCTLELETTEFPSVWELIRDEDWDNFAKWVADNPDRVDTRGRKFSIISTVAASISKAPAVDSPDPIATCVKKGANINEIDPISKDTPIIVLAKRQDEFQRRGLWKDLTVVLSSLIQHGAGIYMRNQAGIAAADLLPGFTIGPTVSFEQSHEITWQKFLSNEQCQNPCDASTPGQIDEKPTNREEFDHRDDFEKVVLKGTVPCETSTPRQIDEQSMNREEMKNRDDLEKVVLKRPAPRESCVQAKATTGQKAPSLGNMPLAVPQLVPRSTKRQSPVAAAGRWRPCFSQELQHHIVEPLQAERWFETPTPPPVGMLKSLRTCHDHRELRLSTPDPIRRIDFSCVANRHLPENVKMIDFSRVGNCPWKMETSKVVLHSPGESWRVQTSVREDRFKETQDGINDVEIRTGDEAAGPVSTCPDTLKMIGLDGMSERSVAFQWAEGKADHKTVRRLEVSVWKVNVNDILRLLRSAADADALIKVYDVDGCAVAEVDALGAKTCAGEFKLNEQLACEKVIPAHLTNSAPAFVVIQGLPHLCPLAVRIRLNREVAITRRAQTNNSGWGIPFFLLHLGPALSAKIDVNSATIISMLEEVARECRSTDTSGISIRAWR